MDREGEVVPDHLTPNRDTAEQVFQGTTNKTVVHILTNQGMDNSLIRRQGMVNKVIVRLGIEEKLARQRGTRTPGLFRKNLVEIGK